MQTSLLNYDCPMFSGEVIDKVAILNLKENLFYNLVDLHAKENIIKYIDLIGKDDSVNILLIMAAPQRIDKEEYIKFYKQFFSPNADIFSLQRLYNGVNQFILKLTHFNKMILHAGGGNVVTLFMNISLACDYRIISSDTIFQNPSMELGMIAKGGGVYFMSKRLGYGKAAELLVSGHDINASEALDLGLVNKVVSPETLRNEAMESARGFAQKNPRTLSELKKLLNFCMKDIEEYLEYENKVLETAIRSGE